VIGQEKGDADLLDFWDERGSLIKKDISYINLYIGDKMKKSHMVAIGSLFLVVLMAGCAMKVADKNTGSLIGGSAASQPSQTQTSYSTLPPPPAGPKLTLSVMDLNVTSGLSPQEVSMLTDKLLNEFVGTKYYKVVERSRRDEILKEQGFQQSGACDQGACLVEAGQLLGVQKMVGGTIGKLGMMYVVELRIMDVKTGEIDQAFSRKYSGDVSNLLDAMREAAIVFSGGTAAPAQPTGTQPVQRPTRKK
jgi:curli biogenesis system outer membrane secretion channel CsgG